MNSAAYSNSAAEAHTEVEIYVHITSTMPLISSWGWLRLVKYWTPPATDRDPGSRLWGASDCMRSIIAHALQSSLTFGHLFAYPMRWNAFLYVLLDGFLRLREMPRSSLRSLRFGYGIGGRRFCQNWWPQLLLNKVAFSEITCEIFGIYPMYTHRGLATTWKSRWPPWITPKNESNYEVFSFCSLAIIISTV